MFVTTTFILSRTFRRLICCLHLRYPLHFFKVSVLCTTSLLLDEIYLFGGKQHFFFFLFSFFFFFFFLYLLILLWIFLISKKEMVDLKQDRLAHWNANFSGKPLNLAEAYSEASRTSTMEIFFAKIVNGQKLTVFAKMLHHK